MLLIKIMFNKRARFAKHSLLVLQIYYIEHIQNKYNILDAEM